MPPAIARLRRWRPPHVAWPDARRARPCCSSGGFPQGRAQIPAFAVVAGDIDRPASLAGELEKRGIDSHDLLRVRSFLDHNRPYTWVGAAARGSRPGESPGAFVYRGALVGAGDMEETSSATAGASHADAGDGCGHLDRTAAIAYDATLGYSDRYLVEAPVFLRCAREGLVVDERFASAFPTPELATVTLSFFTSRT